MEFIVNVPPGLAESMAEKLLPSGKKIMTDGLMLFCLARQAREFSCERSERIIGGVIVGIGSARNDMTNEEALNFSFNIGIGEGAKRLEVDIPKSDLDEFGSCISDCFLIALRHAAHGAGYPLPKTTIEVESRIDELRSMRRKIRVTSQRSDLQ